MVEQKKRLFLGNLPDGVGENDIRKRFDRFGQVSSVEIKVKKINDGKESSTFAFVELATSALQLDQCLVATNGSDMNGLRMRVQVAKESFLSRLKAEREQQQQSNHGKGEPPVQQQSNWGKPASQPVQQQTTNSNYDPLAMLRNFQKSKPSTEFTLAVETRRPVPASPKKDFEPSVGSKLKTFSGKNSKKVFDEVEEESAGGGSLMSKLENYSTMWTDLDAAPVQVETRTDLVPTSGQKRMAEEEDDEEEEEEEEEIPIKKASKLKKPKMTLEENVPEPEKPVVNEEEAKKKEQDNQRRLQSLQQRNEALKSQHNLIKSALSCVDGPGKKHNKIIFDTEEPVEVKKKPKRTREKKGKKPQLFDEEEEFNADDDFKMRPHLDGSTGQELLELQSRFGNDNRFKMDHRFAQNAEGTDNYEEEMEPSAGAEERARQMSILGSLMPSMKTGPVDPTKTKTAAKAFIRFDPNVKEHHDQFEKPMEKVVHQKGGQQLATSATSAIAVPEPLPEVSSERYYQTTSALNIGSSNASSGFSLRTLFHSSAAEEEVDKDEKEEDDSILLESSTAVAKHKKLFKTTIAADGGPVTQPPTGYWKNAGMWHEPLFLQADDARFKEAMDFIHRKATEEAYRDRSKWPEQRDRLLHFSRNKLRHHLQANNNNSSSSNNKEGTKSFSYGGGGGAGGNNKKRRQLGDESSYHFFHGQPDSMSAAVDKKKKKPHRTFYKKK